MANNLSLQNNYTINYKTEDGQQIQLNPQIVRQVLAVGKNVTDSEIFVFLKLCEYQKLNPFLKEAYIVKWSEKQPAQIIVGKDVFTKRLDSHPLCEGWAAGTIVLKQDGSLEERKGTFYLKKSETLVGSWFLVHRKGWKEPFYWSVTYDEYHQSYYDKETRKTVPKGNWGTMPATMIVKCAITSGARNAFPKNFEGMYGEEEMGIDEASTIGITENDDVIQKDNSDFYLTDSQKKFLYAKTNEIAKKEEIEVDSHKLIKFVIERMIKNNDIPENTKIDTIPKDKVNTILDGIEKAIKNKKEKENKKDPSPEEEKKALEEAKQVFDKKETEKKKKTKKKEEKEDPININLDELPIEELDDEK